MKMPSQQQMSGEYKQEATIIWHVPHPQSLTAITQQAEGWLMVRPGRAHTPEM